MSIRLYDSAWVTLDGHDKAFKVQRDARNPAAFNVGDFQYDIDGRPLKTNADAPAIVKLYSLQAAKEAGLATEYNRDVDPSI